jgi:hypothetical protein
MSDHIQAKQPAKSSETSSPIQQEKLPDNQSVTDAVMAQGKQFAAAGAITPQTVTYLQRTHGNHFTRRYVQQQRPQPQRQPQTLTPEALFPMLKTNKPRPMAMPQRQPDATESEKMNASWQPPQQSSVAYRTVAQHVVGQWMNTVQKSGIAGIYHPTNAPNTSINRRPVGTTVGAIAGGLLGAIGGGLVGGLPGAIIGATGGSLAGGAIGNAIGNAAGGTPAPTSIIPTSINRTSIDRNSATLGPTTYGFVFKHTLNTNTGGIITPDVTIAEHVTLGRDDFNTGWGGVPLGTLTWGPGGTASLYGNDMYDNITTPGVNVTDFMPSPPKPGLPAIMETPQTLHYRIGTGSWVQFASVPMILTLRVKPTGGYEVETAINGVGRAQPYTGPTP